jgi:hypothetical protein
LAGWWLGRHAVLAGRRQATGPGHWRTRRNTGQQHRTNASPVDDSQSDGLAYSYGHGYIYCNVHANTFTIANQHFHAESYANTHENSHRHAESNA